MERNMEEVTNAFFNCQICFERLRSPKALSCLHTFCKECIQTESRRHHAQVTGYFPCPVCRRRTQVTAKGIEALPDNFMVSQVADILNKMKLNGDQVNCDICRTIQTETSAKHRCVECDVNFCDDCKTNHEQTKIGSNHKMEPLKKPAMKCTVHLENEIKYFCRDHETCVCVPCTMLDHRSCDVIEIEVAAREKVGHFKTVLKGCQAVLPSLETNLKRINENIDQNQQVVASLDVELSELQTKFNILERRNGRLQLLIEEDSMKKKTMENNMQHLQDVITVSSNLLKHNQPVDFLSVIKCLQIRLEHLTSGVPQDTKPRSPVQNYFSQEQDSRKKSPPDPDYEPHRIVKPLSLTMGKELSKYKTLPASKSPSPIKSDSEMLVCQVKKSKADIGSPRGSRSSSPKFSETDLFMAVVKRSRPGSPRAIPSAPPKEEMDEEAAAATMPRRSSRSSPISIVQPTERSSPTLKKQKGSGSSGKSSSESSEKNKERREKVKKKWLRALEKSTSKNKQKQGNQGVDIIRCCVTTSTASNSTSSLPRLVLRFGEWGTELGKFRGPINVAVAPSGHTAVVDSLNRRIQIFTSEGLLSGTVTELSGRSIFEHILTSVSVVGPHFAIIDMVEISWGISSYAMVLFNTEGKQITRPKILKHDKRKVLQDPRGLAFDCKGNIVVSDVDQSCITVFSGDGYFKKFFGESGSGNMRLNYPHHIQVDEEDNVYVADCWKHCIKVFSMSGQFIGSFGSEGSADGQLHCPEGIHLHKNMLIVADSGNDRVSLFTREGQFVRHIVRDKDGIRSPRGVAITPEGYLLVSQGLSPKENHEIRIYETGHCLE